MTKIVIDKENEITKLENMLETLTDEKDKQSVRFAINIISDFNEVLSERPQGKWIDYSEDGYVECPFCNCLTTCEDNIDELHFCWNCGAKLQKGGAG